MEISKRHCSYRLLLSLLYASSIVSKMTILNSFPNWSFNRFLLRNSMVEMVNISMPLCFRSIANLTYDGSLRNLLFNKSRTI